MSEKSDAFRRQQEPMGADPEPSKSIYEDCLELGIPMINHASDLYIPVTDQTRELLKKHNKSATTFVNQVEGGLWFDVPFAFDPWWKAKARWKAKAKGKEHSNLAEHEKESLR